MLTPVGQITFMLRSVLSDCPKNKWEIYKLALAYNELLEAGELEKCKSFCEELYKDYLCRGVK